LNLVYDIEVFGLFNRKIDKNKAQTSLTILTLLTTTLHLPDFPIIFKNPKYDI
jgi:hypothetical protein